MIEGFLGFEIFDFGISFGQENFGKYFWGSLIYIGIFWGIQNNLKIRDSSRIPAASGNFYGSEIRRGIFLGLNFGSGILGGFVWSTRDFLGVLFLPPFYHPCHLKSGVPPPLPTLGREPSNMFCHFCARCKISIILRSTLRKCTCPWNMLCRQFSIYHWLFLKQVIC